MVNKNDENEVQDDIEITNDSTEINNPEPELEEIEVTEADKLKSLRVKLNEAEAKTRHLNEELQRAKADFLNGKRRLEEERNQDRNRQITIHVEKLLPLYDSFYLAMLDKNTWSKADETWRKGVEGIFAQLLSVLNSYGVTAYDPLGKSFDPNRHEALSNIPTDKKEQHHQIISVIQLGFERKNGDVIEIVRPARVTVGEYSEA